MQHKNTSIKTPLLDLIMKWCTRILISTIWGSATLFGLYIIAFYFIALIKGNTEDWNQVLPGLFNHKTQTATIGIGIHFAAGGIILILGCIQLIDKIRLKYPFLHKWLGRVYVLAALATAIGGLVFIFIKGTIGGIIMDIGFTGYGILTLISALNTIRFAYSKKLKQHRTWAIRLFVLAIGSWLYRMDYGFWFLFTDGLGHTNNFDGPFDNFMAFFFYIPNLLIAEIFIGRYDIMKTKTAKRIAIFIIFMTTIFILLATYFFTKRIWGPPIIKLLTIS